MSAHFMLDTDTCIYLRKRQPPSVANRFRMLKTGEVVISLITYGELLNGALKNREAEAAVQNVKRLVEYIPVQGMTAEVATIYGEVRSQLEQQGKPIGGNDLWIAAHALALNVTLVTNNTREFSRIANLQIENWVGPE